MSNEEAVKIIQTELECIKRNDGTDCDRNCAKCDLVMEDTDIKEALGMAIEALELKMPKKPIYEDIDKYIKNRFITVTLCPSCAREIVTGDMYCIMCGQAIDWEEE